MAIDNSVVEGVHARQAVASNEVWQTALKAVDVDVIWAALLHRIHLQRQSMRLQIGSNMQHVDFTPTADNV